MSEVRKEVRYACCPVCGSFLQKAAIAQSEQICPCCGKNVVVSIKNGKVVEFESKRKSDTEPEVMQFTRALAYAKKMVEVK